jgi:positive regulator of sigma E activity
LTHKHEPQESEIGVVTAVNGRYATILIETNDACASCGASVFCAPGQDGIRRLMADNPINAKIGQQVKIEETDDILLQLSVYQYGLPLLGFAAGIFIPYGLNFNLPPIPQELLFFILGIGGGALAAWYSHHQVKKIAAKNQSHFIIREIVSQ